jgi:hypothetical protein
MDYTTFTFLPHAREQMELRGISDEEVIEAIRSADTAYAGRFGRIVSDKDFGDRVLRVVYNVASEDEAVVITAIPIRKAGGGR